VVHCPRSHFYFKHEKFPLSRFTKAKVNVCLGTDSLATVYKRPKHAVELNLFTEMQTFAANQPQVSPEKILQMATINGARSLGLEQEIGSLEVGKKADLVVIDLNRLHTTPSPNPISTLVYAATGGEVDTVVVDGQIVVEQGQLLTMDEDEVMAQAQQHAQALYKRAGIEIAPKWPVL